MHLLSQKEVILNRPEKNKKEAILNLGKFLIESGYAENGYEEGMLERENLSSTYLGNGIAIPHGTPSVRNLVNKTGLVLFHFPEGIPWTEKGDKAYIAIGIAANSDEHLKLLKKISHVLGEEGVEDSLKSISSFEDIQSIFKEKTNTPWSFSSLDIEEEVISKDMNSLKLKSLARFSEIEPIEKEYLIEAINKEPLPLEEGFWLFENNMPLPSLLNIILVKEPFIYKTHLVKTFLTINNFKENTLLKEIENLLKNKELLKKSSLWNKSQWLENLNISTESKNEYLIEDILLKNENGLHTRPSSTLVKLLKPYSDEILISNISEKTDFVKATSLIKLTSLGAKKGDLLRFKIKGDKSQEILQKIKEAFKNKLGEE